MCVNIENSCAMNVDLLIEVTTSLRWICRTWCLIGVLRYFVPVLQKIESRKNIITAWRWSAPVTIGQAVSLETSWTWLEAVLTSPSSSSSFSSSCYDLLCSDLICFFSLTWHAVIALFLETPCWDCCSDCSMALETNGFSRSSFEQYVWAKQHKEMYLNS